MRLLFLSIAVALSAAGMSVRAGETFENSLGQRFVQIPGNGNLMAVYETQVAPYSVFARETSRTWLKPSFSQTPQHPAVNVSWEDAKAFTRWLTEKEHASGKLSHEWSYRLPTDAEWSLAVGLDATRSAGAESYPWGSGWPPPPNAGNYSPELQVDKFAATSPAGSFAANKNGFFDLGGNVWEWCEDAFNNSPDYRILRGASWRMRGPVDLLSDNRIGNEPSMRLPVYGFRLVIERPAPKLPEATPSPKTTNPPPAKK